MKRRRDSREDENAPDETRGRVRPSWPSKNRVELDQGGGQKHEDRPHEQDCERDRTGLHRGRGEQNPKCSATQGSDYRCLGIARQRGKATGAFLYVETMGDWYCEGNVQVAIADYLKASGWTIESLADCR